MARCFASTLFFLAMLLTSNIVSAQDMEYVNVCRAQNDCRKFSRLIMGTDHLAQAEWIQPGQPEASEAQIFAVLDEAARLGINFFDTAPIYVGGIENKLGKWLKSRRGWLAANKLNPDGKAYLLSKGGFPFDLFYAKKLEGGSYSPQFIRDLKAQGILDREPSRQSDGSVNLTNVPPGTYASRLYGDVREMSGRVAGELKHSVDNLGDDLTIYLMHRDDGDYIKFNPVLRPQTPVQAIMTALSSPNLASKYWLIGWSNWQTSRVNQSIQIASRDKRFVRPTFNSSYFSLFEMTRRTIHAGGVQVTHKEMMDPNFQRGILQDPYSPLGGFSVLDKPEPRWENAKKDAKAKFEAGDAYWQNVYPAIFTPANEARFKRAESFTRQFNTKHHTNYTVDQMINAYALAHKRTNFLTIGPVNVVELRRTVASLKLARMLTTKDLDYLYSGN